jgi:flagellar hook protein FlgE
MALSSVMRTALTGVSAAVSAVSVVANNLANANTTGFKQSRVEFSTQTPSTYGLGAAPSSGSGGSNPTQIGLGVRVAAINHDSGQGTIALNALPSNLALEGDGFFIIQGSNNERLYTRDGTFEFNAAGELITSTGHRVLGYGADEDFEIQTGELTPIRVRLGTQTESQDGSAATLTSFSVGEDGTVLGHFTDGVSRPLGRVRIARFTNSSGLIHHGDNLYSPRPNSGRPIESDAGEGGTAEIVGGATELSNTDIGGNLIDLTEASTLFRASLAVISTSDQLLDELLQLRRGN